MGEPIFSLDALHIDVKVYGGKDIPTAIHQMVLLANRTGLSIWAELNGVRTLARPGDDAQMICVDWADAVKHQRSHASQRVIYATVDRTAK
jgi:hypothetical protein